MRSQLKYAEQHKILEDKYLALKKQKFTDVLICSTLKISKASLLRWKAKRGLINSRPFKLTGFTVKDYSELKSEKMNDGEICKLLDVERKTLWYWKERNNVARQKRYPVTPRVLPEGCLATIKKLYPLTEFIQNSDIKSLATERLIRTAWIFHCKSENGAPLTDEDQRRYYSKIIGYAFKQHKVNKTLD